MTTDRGEYNFLSQAISDQARLGDVHRQPGSESDAADHRRVSGANGDARRDQHQRARSAARSEQPKLSLESDAQPPRTQSELLSSSRVRPVDDVAARDRASSSIAGSAATTELFGVGAQFAVRRLAGVALGVAVEQVEMQAGRAFGTDVFDITPGDVPHRVSVSSATSSRRRSSRRASTSIREPSSAVQEQARASASAIEHRTADGWHFTASVEPRILLLEPQLNSQPFRTVHRVRRRSSFASGDSRRSQCRRVER